MIIRSLDEHHPDKSLINWQNITSKLPEIIIRFSRRFPAYSLSNFSINRNVWRQNSILKTVTNDLELN